MIPLFKVNMGPRAPEMVTKVLNSGFVGQGPQVDAFEAELEAVLPTPIVLTNSCTSAIEMVLTYLEVGPGDEVITSPMTCIASNSPILAVGARPVWADVDPVTGNINPRDVQRKVTPRTKAIIAVNWTGRAAPYNELRECRLPIIEDAAHGPLSTLPREDRGDFTCYSFGPIKHLTSGDGGGVGTDDATARAALRLLRWYGLDRTSTKDFRCAQDIVYPGQKWHMNDINAAIGRSNLPGLQAAVHAHRENARRMRNGIRNEHVRMPFWDENSNYWVFPLLVEQRDAFRDYMRAHGIDASQVHARNDKHTGYNFPAGPLPGLDKFDAQQINVPCGWWLTPEDVTRIINLINMYGG